MDIESIPLKPSKSKQTKISDDIIKRIKGVNVLTASRGEIIKNLSEDLKKKLEELEKKFIQVYEKILEVAGVNSLEDLCKKVSKVSRFKREQSVIAIGYMLKEKKRLPVKLSDIVTFSDLIIHGIEVNYLFRKELQNIEDMIYSNALLALLLILKLRDIDKEFYVNFYDFAEGKKKGKLIFRGIRIGNILIGIEINEKDDIYALFMSGNKIKNFESVDEVVNEKLKEGPRSEEDVEDVQRTLQEVRNILLIINERQSTLSWKIKHLGIYSEIFIQIKEDGTIEKIFLVSHYIDDELENRSITEEEKLLDYFNKDYRIYHDSSDVNELVKALKELKNQDIDVKITISNKKSFRSSQYGEKFEIIDGKFIEKQAESEAKYAKGEELLDEKLSKLAKQ